MVDEESSLCVLGLHLLPLFIGCKRLDAWRRRRGVDCMFSSLAQPLCLQAAGGGGGGGRARDVKPDLPHSSPSTALASPSLPPEPCQRASQTTLLSTVIRSSSSSNLPDWKQLSEREEREEKEKKGEEWKRKRENSQCGPQDWKHSQESEKWEQVDRAEEGETQEGPGKQRRDKEKWEQRRTLHSRKKKMKKVACGWRWMKTNHWRWSSGQRVRSKTCKDL